MKIGIVGAQNSHAQIIARHLNVDRLVDGVTVDCIWGETPELAVQTAGAAGIPNVVQCPEQMIGHIDAVIINHRHCKYHLEAATPFLEASLPMFIDKPFCYDVQEGRRFLSLAHEKRVPVTSYSILTLQKSFSTFRQKIEGIGEILAGSSYGPCDILSPYGGIFFYGIHQIDMVLHAFGDDLYTIQVTKNGSNACAALRWENGKTVTVHFIKSGLDEFHLTAVGSKKVLHCPVDFDRHPHMSGIKRFVNMFKTGRQPLTHSQMIRPIEILKALEKSIQTGKCQLVDLQYN